MCDLFDLGSHGLDFIAGATSFTAKMKDGSEAVDATDQ